MRLIASLLVHNELGRYLEPCVEHLLSFCDEVRALDDGSTDGSCEWLCGRAGVELLGGGPPTFFRHEGSTRQELLDWTLEGSPDYVLTVDADEFVAGGSRLRAAIERNRTALVWTLTMREVWDLDSSAILTREDGGWRSHPIPALWRVPARLDDSWRIAPRALACGREPQAVRRVYAHGGAQLAPADILHFGWADERDRRRRYDRYAVADGGRFHSSQHLQSIMWPPERVQLAELGWPADLPRRELLSRAGKVAA